MSRKPDLVKNLQIVKVHFTIPNKEKRVLLPDKFSFDDYPARTQKGLRNLKKLGYNLQTHIQ